MFFFLPRRNRSRVANPPSITILAIPGPCCPLYTLKLLPGNVYPCVTNKKVDEAFKVKEYDEEGNEVQNVSTLDEFEHFWKSYADFGLGLFALVNAGVKVEGPLGAMTGLVLLSLVVGKYLGIVSMFLVRGAHSYMDKALA